MFSFDKVSNLDKKLNKLNKLGKSQLFWCRIRIKTSGPRTLNACLVRWALICMKGWVGCHGAGS